LIVALVPAFNEEHYVASVLVRLSGMVDGVVVCDDGSVDLTGSIAEAVGATVVLC
jgi:glycosyltransferase involved in cell wall biosynthesis